MDAQVERLLARVATADSGTDFNAEDWERLYTVAVFACTHDLVPSADEVQSCLVRFGCGQQKSIVLSQQFAHLCEVLKPGDQRPGT
jgi:hypothetical protein